MLFLPPGTSRLVRVHGAYVDEKEVKKIADSRSRTGQSKITRNIQMSDKEMKARR
jgi:S-DNA-T family DNA segregation ATPase FtsK/SpoIIIE